MPAGTEPVSDYGTIARCLMKHAELLPIGFYRSAAHHERTIHQPIHHFVRAVNPDMAAK